jgi:hypothetical protein
MPNNNPNNKKNGGQGTAAGNFLRSINFGKVAEVVGSIAMGDVKSAIEAINKDPNALTSEQRDYALKLIELDLQDMKGVSERWGHDLSSDSFLSKNVRPMTLIFLTVMTMVLAIGDSLGASFNVDSAWIDLLKTLLVTVFVAYFGGRSFEKTKRL